MFVFLIYFGSSNEITCTIGIKLCFDDNFIQSGSVHLLEGNTLCIYSDEPYLSVALLQMIDSSVDVYSQKNSPILHEERNSSKFGGFYLGKTPGIVKITAHEEGNIDFSAIIFQPDCETRIISTKLEDTFSLTSDCRGDGCIGPNNTVCFFSAALSSRTIHIDLDIRNKEDNLLMIYYDPKQAQKKYDRSLRETVNVNFSSPTYFRWVSGLSTNLSNHVDVNIISNYKRDFYQIRENLYDEVTIILGVKKIQFTILWIIIAVLLALTLLIIFLLHRYWFAITSFLCCTKREDKFGVPLIEETFVNSNKYQSENDLENGNNNIPFDSNEKSTEELCTISTSNDINNISQDEVAEP